MKLFNQQLSPAELEWMEKMVALMTKLESAAEQDLEQIYDELLNKTPLDDLISLHQQYQSKLARLQREVIETPPKLKSRNFPADKIKMIANILRQDLIKCLMISPRLESILTQRTHSQEAFRSFPANR